MEINDILNIKHIRREEKDGGVETSENSLYNLCRDKVIYKSMSYVNTKKQHIFSEPYFGLIVDKNNIIEKMEKINFEAIIMLNSKYKEYSEYYEIELKNGKIYRIQLSDIEEKIRFKLEDLIEKNKCIGNVSSKLIEESPFLIFKESDLNKKIDYLKNVSEAFCQKNFKVFYNLLDKDCRMEIHDSKNMIMDKKTDIVRYHKNVFGFFNFNIYGYVSADFYGFLSNNGKSQIALNISYLNRGKNEYRKEFIYNIDINEKNKICNINVYEKKDIPCKKLNNKAIEYIRDCRYDDEDEEMVIEINGCNKTYSEFMDETFGSKNKGTQTYLNTIKK